MEAEFQSKRIAVICATRNAGLTLASMLESYVAGRTDETELIVVDSCSTDNTHAILSRFDFCIDKLIIEPDRSIYDAWNKGISAASAGYVCFIGADDVIVPGAIAVLLRSVGAHSEMDLIHGHNILLRDGQISGVIGRPYKSDTIEKFLPMAHVMAAHRRKWLIDNDGFDANFTSSGDYDFLLRVRKTMRVYNCQSILAFVNDDGISRRSIKPILECFRSRKQHDVGMIRNVAWTMRGLIGFWIRQGLRRFRMH